jgi:hypothetical protein
MESTCQSVNIVEQRDLLAAHAARVHPVAMLFTSRASAYTAAPQRAVAEHAVRVRQRDMWWIPAQRNAYIAAQQLVVAVHAERVQLKVTSLVAALFSLFLLRAV